MAVKAKKRFYDLEEKKYIEAGEEITASDERLQKMIARGLAEQTEGYTPTYSSRIKKGDSSGTGTN